MQLGRAYALAGRKAEALQTFSRIVDEFPQSLYAADARREADALRGGTTERQS
jgi:outer membrane protein assembly factor BamD (BamD/ComL family)